MGAYRKNVSDKEQVDIENALNSSAIRVQSFDGKASQTGQTKFVKAYDRAAQAPSTDGVTSVVSQAGGGLGSHNDKPSVFENPGKPGPTPPPIPPTPKVVITVQASPLAGGIVAGGGLYKVGKSVQISASPNPGYSFGNWSDGGPQSHFITVPPVATTYTASFALIPPPPSKLYRIDFGQFHNFIPPETDPTGEFMHSGIANQADPTPAPGPCNNNWDVPTATLDSHFGNDGVNHWNLLYNTAAGNYPLIDSLGGSGVASIDLPVAGGGAGSGQGDLNNWFRAGFLDYNTADAPFVIHLGPTAAGKTIKLAWSLLGVVNPATAAITIGGNTVQTVWGPGNVVFQTVVADGAGDVSGVFISSAGSNVPGDMPLAGLQIYQA